jgi:hypothetical protein
VSSSDPQPPVEPGRPRQPSTQEIPVVHPPAGATAVQQLPPHPNATTPAPVQAMDAPVPTCPVDFVPGLPGLGGPPPPPPVPPTTAPAPAASAASATTATPAPTWPETLESGPTDDGPKKRRARRPRDLATLLGFGLVVLSVVLLEVGLALDVDGATFWSVVPLWSAFATGCALLALVAFAASHSAGERLRSGSAWRVAAGGLVGLAVFWLLVALPVVDTDRGFLLTAALGALGAALWVGPHRKG